MQQRFGLSFQEDLYVGEVRKLLAPCAVAPVNRPVLEEALELDFADFEDAVLHEAEIGRLDWAALPGILDSMAEHPNKHIRAAIRYARSRGWTVEKAGARAHIWGTLWCPQRTRDGCRIRVMSTPRHPERHAHDIRRDVDRCPHS